MSNFLTDLIDKLDLKTNIWKIVTKWVVGIAVTLMSAAFIFGQLKMARLNRLDDIEKTQKEQTEMIRNLDMNNAAEFQMLNRRIDKIYLDGINEFKDYQDFNKKQLELIIDYGSTNSELLKKILDINITEKTKQVEMQAQESVLKKTLPNSPVTNEQNLNTLGYESMLYIVTPAKDTIIAVVGATRKYYNSIDRTKFNISEEIEHPSKPELINFRYIRKK